MPDYEMRLRFTAADDAQAQRLARAWADTCAAEYGTRYAGVWCGRCTTPHLLSRETSTAAPDLSAVPYLGAGVCDLHDVCRAGQRQCPYHQVLANESLPDTEEGPMRCRRCGEKGPTVFGSGPWAHPGWRCTPCAKVMGASESLSDASNSAEAEP